MSDNHEEGELDQRATIRKYRIVQTGGNRHVDHLCKSGTTVKEYLTVQRNAIYQRHHLVCRPPTVKESLIVVPLAARVAQSACGYHGLWPNATIRRDRIVPCQRRASAWESSNAITLNGKPLLEHEVVPWGEQEAKAIGALAEISYCMAISSGYAPSFELKASSDDNSGQQRRYHATLTV